MERVSEYLSSQDDPVSKANIERSVSGKGEGVRAAIAVLVEEGYARQSEGKQGARMIEFVRFFRQSDDDFQGDEQTSSQPRPNLVPSLTSTPAFDLVPSSPSIGDEDEVKSRPRPETSSLPILNVVCSTPGCGRRRVLGATLCAPCFDAANAGPA